MVSEWHFAAEPETILCGKLPVKTLCGLHHLDTTNWDVEAVTCERCLEVMEERATGDNQPARRPKVTANLVEAAPAHWPMTVVDCWAKEAKRMEAIRLQQEMEMLARVKKKY